jgi:hypothetical protein
MIKSPFAFLFYCLAERFIALPLHFPAMLFPLTAARCPAPLFLCDSFHCFAFANLSLAMSLLCPCYAVRGLPMPTLYNAGLCFANAWQFSAKLHFANALQCCTLPLRSSPFLRRSGSKLCNALPSLISTATG